MIVPPSEGSGYRLSRYYWLSKNLFQKSLANPHQQGSALLVGINEVGNFELIKALDRKPRFVTQVNESQ